MWQIAHHKQVECVGFRHSTEDPMHELPFAAGLHRRTIIAIGLFAALVGCAADPTYSEWPAHLRRDLAPKWIQWNAQTSSATILWPEDDGCDGSATTRVLPVGMLLDRFGSESGTFFGSRGESFTSRAMPYVCERVEYRLYVVERPIDVKECSTAQWFGERGGAVEFKTQRSAKDLVEEGSLMTLSVYHAGNGAPSPQCRVAN
jgi:hypothetical protein